MGIAVLQFLTDNALLDGKLKVRTMMLPDTFIEHGTQAQQLTEALLTVKDIVDTAVTALGPVSARPVIIPAQGSVSPPTPSQPLSPTQSIPATPSQPLSPTQSSPASPSQPVPSPAV